MGRLLPDASGLKDTAYVTDVRAAGMTAVIDAKCVRDAMHMEGHDAVPTKSLWSTVAHVLSCFAAQRP